MHTTFFRASTAAITLGVFACGGSGRDAAPTSGNGGASVSGGSSAGQSGGAVSNTLLSGGGSSHTTGGTLTSTGGSSHSNGSATGGTKAVGGTSSGNTAGTATGGVSTTIGGAATGGVALGGAGGRVVSGGNSATGGVTIGGNSATGGVAIGGNSARGGTATSGAGTSSTAPADPCLVTNTLSGGTPHCNKNQSGNYGNQEWEFWSNQPNGCLTTYGNAEDAFSVNWDNSADLLGMVGLVFDATKTPQELGNVSADYAQIHEGTGGGYSYIGVYGWTKTPSVEFYIVDDSFSAFPFKPWASVKLTTFQVDGGTYDTYYAEMSGTTIIGQLYSVRQTRRQCGRISVSEHFAQWAGAGKILGKLTEVRVFVEVSGGTGSIDFTTARVKVN